MTVTRDNRRPARRRGMGPYTLTTTAYIDAIEHRAIDWLRWLNFGNDLIAPAEDSIPVGTQRHLNFFQGADDPDDAPGDGEADRSNWPNGRSVGGFINVNMDLNAAVRSSPNVGNTLFEVFPGTVYDPTLATPAEPDVGNRFTHTTIDNQLPILREIRDWFVEDLL